MSSSPRGEEHYPSYCEPGKLDHGGYGRAPASDEEVAIDEAVVRVAQLYGFEVFGILREFTQVQKGPVPILEARKQRACANLRATRCF